MKKTSSTTTTTTKQATERENTFTNFISDNGLISKINSGGQK